VGAVEEEEGAVAVDEKAADVGLGDGPSNVLRHPRQESGEQLWAALPSGPAGELCQPRGDAAHHVGAGVPPGPGRAGVEVAVQGRGGLRQLVGGGFAAMVLSDLRKAVVTLVMRLKGGNKGLLQNSRDICRQAFRATVKMDAHTGRSTTPSR
jgi:hypothetical protein